MKNNLLLEIGIENFPSAYLGLVKRTLDEDFTKALYFGGYSFDNISIESTKRRIIIIIEDIKNNKIVDIDKRRDIEDVLREEIPKLISKIAIPVYEADDAHSSNFIDYITWIQCVYNNNIISFHEENPIYEDNDHDDKDYIKLTNIDDYKKALEAKYILMHKEKRREYYELRAKRLAREYGGELSENKYLIEQYVNIYDYPFPFIGKLKNKYLALEKEIIDSVLLEDFMLLPVVGDKGQSTIYYIGAVERYNKDNEELFSNISQRVEMRFKKIMDLYSEDLYQNFEDYIEDLKEIPAENNFGNYYDKTNRIVEISKLVGENLDVGEETLSNIETAAKLCKADLATNMVQEIPFLKGVMGMIYTQKYGEKPIVSKSIRDHYRPKYYLDILPESTSARVLSFSDKLDYITTYYLKNKDKDIFSETRELRNAGMGIVNIIIDAKWLMLDMNLMVRDVLYVFLKEGDVIFDYEQISDRIINYIKAKLRDELIKQGFRFYIIDGVMEKSKFDIYDIYLKVCNLTEIIKETNKEFLNYIHDIDEFIDKYLVDNEDIDLSNVMTEYKDDLIEDPLNLRQYKKMFDYMWKLRESLYKAMADIEVIENNDNILENEQFKKIYYYNKKMKVVFDIKDVLLS